MSKTIIVFSAFNKFPNHSIGAGTSKRLKSFCDPRLARDAGVGDLGFVKRTILSDSNEAAGTERVDPMAPFYRILRSISLRWSQ
ncbi:hypothetical protein G9A89_004653 [Geosiphon pyriformis]|nr:hypothetical protein G9A89_004653 [Geosiphon pyriformis]